MNIYLLEQLKQHPSIQPQDIVKMCFQAVYGVEHILQDTMKAKEFLYSEFDNTTVANIPMYENISQEYCRVNISGWKFYNRSREELFELFIKTSNISTKNNNFYTLMEDYIDTVTNVMSSDELAELKMYLADYYKNGIHPVHHSEKYRENEDPHYRVIRRALLPKN